MRGTRIPVPVAADDEKTIDQLRGLVYLNYKFGTQPVGTQSVISFCMWFGGMSFAENALSIVCSLDRMRRCVVQFLRTHVVQLMRILRRHFRHVVGPANARFPSTS